MPNFGTLAAASSAGGLQYYDTQPFSRAIPGQFLAKFAGVTNHYTTNISLVKNRSGIALTNQIMTSVLANFDNELPAGTYYSLSNSYQQTFIIGTSGGFPIYYVMNVNVNSDGTNLNIQVDIGNGSAVNDCTPPTITISGTAYFYLAPF